MNQTPDTDKDMFTVVVIYDKTLDLITATFEQDNRTIILGLDIQEAQLFNTQLASAITEAILGKLNITTPLSGTKH